MIFNRSIAKKKAFLIIEWDDDKHHSLQKMEFIWDNGEAKADKLALP